jgi:two-component sensor histidine kinase
VLTAQVVLPGLSSSVPTARHVVESLLTSWGQPDLAWTAALVVSELTANCALHARTDFSVRVSQRADGVVRLEVADASVRVPQQRTYSQDATTGRGLRLVAQLSTDWGVEASATGKTVWALLAPDGAGDADRNEGELLAAYLDDGV